MNYMKSSYLLLWTFLVSFKNKQNINILFNKKTVKKKHFKIA